MQVAAQKFVDEARSRELAAGEMWKSTVGEFMKDRGALSSGARRDVCGSSELDSDPFRGMREQIASGTIGVVQVPRLSKPLRDKSWFAQYVGAALYQAMIADYISYVNVNGSVVDTDMGTDIASIVCKTPSTIIGKNPSKKYMSRFQATADVNEFPEITLPMLGRVRVVSDGAVLPGKVGYDMGPIMSFDGSPSGYKAVVLPDPEMTQLGGGVPTVLLLLLALLDLVLGNSCIGYWSVRVWHSGIM